MQAKRDQNRITTLLGALKTNGKTPQLICADPTTHTLCVEDNTTGSDFVIENDPRDENRIPIAMAVSKDDDSTPVPLYADNLYQLLIDSN
jgi:hypothetical protein